MRFLPILVLAGLPCAALAQTTVTPVQKTPQSLLTGAPPTAALGLPADPAVPKTGALVASRAADSAMSDFDTDKIVGNQPVPVPLSLRSKAPGTLPDPAPSAGDLGTGPAGEKVAALVATKAADGAVSTYDTDKIVGNPETFPPLAPRQKAPSALPDVATPADLGQPATPPAAKTADLVALHAQGTPSIYDEDKIAGNEPPPVPLAERQKAPSALTDEPAISDLGLPVTPAAPKTADLAAFHAASVPTTYDTDKIAGNDDTYVQGPLAERQKYPSELAPGTDSAAFGLPAAQGPKLADLGISKAELAVPTVEDNDKIAGNPYVAPPLLPRQKLPSALPDPVADADMGQPAADVAKTDLTVSKAAENRPTVEDNDKIVGNPVVSPPLSDRAKLPSTNPVAAGLAAVDLGLPADPTAAKTATTDSSKSQDGVATEYDEDKIAGNSYPDPAPADDYSYEDQYPTPPAELIAQVRALLDDPATRAGLLDGIATRGIAPAPLVPAFQSYVGQLFDAPQVRDLMATEIARVYMNMGLTPDNPAALGRVGAEYMAAFGGPQALAGLVRLSAADQRAYLTGTLRLADKLPAAGCAALLDGSMDATQQMRLLLDGLADAPADMQASVLASRAAAILASLQDNLPEAALPDADMRRVSAQLGAQALTAIDGLENGADLLAAFGDRYNATPENNCAVQKLIISTTLANTGPDADLGVRYLVTHGWQN